MKLNAIKGACIREGKFFIYNEPCGQQWIGNGTAFWPVDGIELTTENIPAVFDLSPKKLEKLVIRTIGPDIEEPRVTREPMREQETLCEEAPVKITLRKITYVPIYTEQGVMFIDAAHLKPAENTDGYLEFYVRQNETGNVLIACYGNMFVSAVVAPVPDSMAAEIIEAVKTFGEKPVAPVYGWAVYGWAEEETPEALPAPEEVNGQLALPEPEVLEGDGEVT